MRLAAKNTLSLLIVYLIAFIGLAIWIQADLRTAGRAILEDTATLLGRQILAVLNESLVDKLLAGDRDELKALLAMLESAEQRSVGVGAIDVVNARGKVVTSSDESHIGQNAERPEWLFGDQRAPRLQSAFTYPFSRGIHRLQLPLQRSGKLLGYLQTELQNKPIAELYDDVYSKLAIALMGGLVIIAGLGLLLQRQLSRLNRELAALATSPLADPTNIPKTADDDFSALRAAAIRLGSEVRAARSKAEAARKNLDTLASLMQVGVVLVGADGKVEFISEAAKDLLGNARPEDREHNLQALYRSVDEAVTRIRTQNLGMYTLEIDRPMLGGARRLCLEFYPADLHEWKGCLILIREQAMLEALQSDLREAARFRGIARLYMGVAHDLRSPLNSMVINLEMLKRTFQEDASTDPDRRERRERYAAVLTQEIANLNRLLGSLLDLLSPHLEHKHDLDLRGLVKGLQILIAPQAQKQEVLLDFQLLSSPVMVHGCESQLRLAILNIIVNALDAMPKEGVLEARITIDNAEEFAELTLCDTGPGIASSIAERIFDMHFTTKNTNAGTGIGLYVARAVAEKHGGSIQVESTLGEGACFHLLLPLASRRNDTVSKS
ncbi:MAG: PAS domain-containing sensor histidine kinase [Gammaproteobacteria bacterium]